MKGGFPQTTLRQKLPKPPPTPLVLSLSMDAVPRSNHAVALWTCILHCDDESYYTGLRGYTAGRPGLNYALRKIQLVPHITRENSLM